MPKPLRYADAVKLLGGSGPAVQVFDNLAGAALSIATAGGSEVALSFFDAKAEVSRLGRDLTGKLHERVRGLARHDRSSRLRAAHAILVVSAFFEAFDDLTDGTGLPAPSFTRDEQLTLAGATVSGDWLDMLLRAYTPVPSPEVPYGAFLAELRDWYFVVGRHFTEFLTGLADWDRATERERRAVTQLLLDRHPAAAVQRYEAAHRRLAVDIPEFAIWIDRTETQALGRGLAALESALSRATSGRDPERHRAALARSYQAELARPIIGGTPREVIVPVFGTAYVDPHFRVKAVSSGSTPADEHWWDTEPRADLAAFLAEYLTTPEAVEAPLLLLGQPGAGKSALTRILAARLPAADFLAVRVALREVPAESDIQHQIEHALRREIGETIAWPELARSAGGALPVIMLDGFDELLQATGVHRSDYLQRVLAFQEREAIQGRPVAVIVTTRVAVADRARIPAPGLAVRLEPFDADQVAQWLASWNQANARPGRPDLPLDVVLRFPELSGQPLLLLMLALYDETDNALQRRASQESFDAADLYEQLLSDFAEREVRRLLPDRPDAEIRDAVEEELTRLSVVAFAMFNRARQWVTQPELDDDLAGLGISAVAAPRPGSFRGALTAGEELVGRFFFVQRAQALQEGKQLQTYEFLHATFGEYLVARLVVNELTEAARHKFWARALRAGRPNDELLESLLSFQPLTSRNTVLPFVTTLLAGADRPAVAEWLFARLQMLFTNREIEAPAVYSINLLLLRLSCGQTLRASDLMTEAVDPADAMRHAMQLSRSSVPSFQWFEVVAAMAVTRTWLPDGRRDLVLSPAQGEPTEDVEPFWSHEIPPGDDVRQWAKGGGLANHFPVEEARRSMHLTGDISDDALRHAVEPLIRELPETISAFVVHGPDDLESIANTLIRLWLTSAVSNDPDKLAECYERAATAVSSYGWGPGTDNASAVPSITAVLRSLGQDAGRVPPDRLIGVLDTICEAGYFDESHVQLVLTCLSVADVPDGPDKDRILDAIVNATAVRRVAPE